MTRRMSDLARGTLDLVNADRKMQAVQMRLLAGEVKTDMEHFELYGFTSNAHPGAEGVAVFFGGDRSHGVVLCIADRRFRLKGLEPGEVALYTDEGDFLHFKRGRVIEVKTQTLRVTAEESVVFDTPLITTTGEIRAAGDVLAGPVSLQGHLHPGVQRGDALTDPPQGG